MKKSLGARTLAQPAPVWVVGSYDAQGKPNMMTIAWGGICCSQPPCIAVSVRKVTYTYGNLIERKAFTVNIPSTELIKEADYVGTVSGKNVDKFAMTGLTPIRSELVDAPYVKEFPVVIECKLLHIVEIGQHTQFVGEILDVKADAKVLDDKGELDVEKLRPFFFAPEANAYYGTGKRLGDAFSIGQAVRKKGK